MLWKKNALLQIAITIGTIVILCIAVFSKVETTITELLRNNLQHELNIIEDSLSSQLTASQQKALEIVVAGNVQAYFCSEEKSEEQRIKLENYYSDWYDFYAVHLYSIDEKDLTPEEEKLISSALEKDGPFFYDWKEDQESSKRIRLTKTVYNNKDWKNAIGVVSVEINPSSVNNLFSAQAYSERFAIVDQEGNLCFSNYFVHPDLLEGISLNKKDQSVGDYIVSISKLDSTGWNLVSFVSAEIISQQHQQILQVILLIGSVLILLLIGVNLLTSAYMFRPIGELTSAIHEYTKNGCGADAIVTPHLQKEKGEMGKLYQSFLFMANTIENLIDQVYMAEIRKKDAELSALQAQINPHFLYNTLDSVNWLADQYGAKDIERIVTSLATMMRFSLNKGSNIITIENELKQITGYLTIQTIRYDNAFDYEIDVPQSLYDRKIIKLILQPLVENAIIHGYEANSLQGHIVVRAREESGSIVFSVINDGAEVDLQKIEALLHSAPFERSEGYGIKNVQSRLVTQYGPESSLHYTVENGKTIVTFRIPQ